MILYWSLLTTGHNSFTLKVLLKWKETKVRAESYRKSRQEEAKEWKGHRWEQPIVCPPSPPRGDGRLNSSGYMGQKAGISPTKCQQEWTHRTHLRNDIGIIFPVNDGHGGTPTGCKVPWWSPHWGYSSGAGRTVARPHHDVWVVTIVSVVLNARAHVGCHCKATYCMSVSECCF